MKALNAIYQDGVVRFLYDFPEIDGPVQVLVVFPRLCEELEQDMIIEEDDFDASLYQQAFAVASGPRSRSITDPASIIDLDEDEPYRWY